MGDGIVGLVLVGLIGYFVLRRIRGREERAERRAAQRKRSEMAAADQKRWLESPIAATKAVKEMERLVREGRSEDAIAFGDDVIAQLDWLTSEKGHQALKRSGRPITSPLTTDLLELCARVDLMLAVAEAKLVIAESTGRLSLASEACRLAIRATTLAERRQLTTFGYEDPRYTQMGICSRRADLYTAQGKPVPDERR